MAVKASTNITIVDVSDGEKGDGILSTKITYQAGTSGTEKPTGEWSENIPKTDANNPYLWTKVTYTYTDGRTPVDVYSVGCTPEGIEIGGNNILSASGHWSTLPPTKYWSNNGGGLSLDTNIKYLGYNTLRTDSLGGIKGYYDWIELDSNKTYTYSAMIKSNDNVNVNNFISDYPLYCQYSENKKTFVDTITPISYDQSLKKNEWKLVYLTFKPQYKYWRPFIKNKIGSYIFNIAYIKLEEGNKATPWSPSAEDNILSETKIQYYISTSSTDLINGEWLDTLPSECSESEYIWTRNIFIYNNGYMHESNACYNQPLTESYRGELTKFKTEVNKMLNSENPTTTIGDDYIISPKIGGGYMYLTNPDSNISVEIDPKKLRTKDGYVFAIKKIIENKENVIMGVDGQGNGTFDGKITSKSGTIGGFTIGDTSLRKIFYDGNRLYDFYMQSASATASTENLLACRYSDDGKDCEWEDRNWTVVFRINYQGDGVFNNLYIPYGSALYIKDSNGTNRIAASIKNRDDGSPVYCFGTGEFLNDIYLGNRKNTKIDDTTTQINATLDIIARCSSSLRPGTNNGIELGTQDFKWSQIYSSSSIISTSDRNLKKNILKLDDKYIELFKKLIPVSFQFVDGTSGRTHIGFISQDVEQAMTEVGISDLEFAGFCKDVKRIIVEDENGFTKAGDICYDSEGNPEYIYSLRYEEFIALNTKMIQLQQSKINSQEQKIKELEERLQKIEERLGGV